MNSCGATAIPRPQAATGEPRSFLFLEGPISDFFCELGRALLARGHRVHRVNFNLGDQLFWRLPATHYRGRLDEWRPCIARLLEEHEVTDLVLLGDRRPHHLIAAEEARARGIPVLCTELGYVRPDWTTLEYDGMSTYSRFPRDPAAIRELARHFGAPDLEARFHTPFRLLAALDVAYNVALVFGRPLYPHYHWHGIYHPFREYAGWFVTVTRQYLTRRSRAAAKARLAAAPGSYFLFPLQLATDYQIRAHSPFADARDAVREVVGSFAASGSKRRLVIFVHPLDNGLINWRRLATGCARRLGVADRVEILERGIPIDVLQSAAGLVTINSTVGVTALQHGVPVKVLGNAVFDVPGLAYQGSLDAFWRDPSPPDPALMEDFLRALVGTTQLKGGFYEPSAKAHAVAGFVERLEQGPHPLPPLCAADLAARKLAEVRLTVAIAGAASELGLALARAYAAPGVRLFLIDSASPELTAAAEDCRRRGAVVEACAVARGDPAGGAAAARHLVEYDGRAPIDILVAQADDDGRNLVGALAARFRRRGHGSIVLVDTSGGPVALDDPPADHRALGRLLRANKVAVSVVRPGRVAAAVAARCGDPRLAAIGADRAAERVRRGVARGRKVIALPGPLTVALRMLSWWPSAFGDWAGGTLVPRVEAIEEHGEEAPLPGE